MLIFVFFAHIGCSFEHITENEITYSIIDENYLLVGSENITSTHTAANMPPNAVSDESITSVTIPEYVHGYPVIEIGSRAFSECYLLRTVTIKAKIRQISNFAFYRCRSLTSINIPPTCEYIGYAAISCIISVGENQAAKGVLTVKFEPNTTVKYIDKYGIERKQVIIIFYCGDTPPEVNDDALFYYSTYKVIYAPKQMTWGGVEATVDENTCLVMTDPVEFKERTCQRKKTYFLHPLPFFFEILFKR